LFDAVKPFLGNKICNANLLVITTLFVIASEAKQSGKTSKLTAAPMRSMPPPSVIARSAGEAKQKVISFFRHCEERSDEAIHTSFRHFHKPIRSTCTILCHCEARSAAAIQLLQEINGEAIYYIPSLRGGTTTQSTSKIRKK
jgi:rhodanese-related sulfurtransferase